MSLRRAHRRSSAQWPYTIQHASPDPAATCGFAQGHYNGMPEELDHEVALEGTVTSPPGALAAQLRRIPPSSWHRDRTVPAVGPPRAQRVKGGVEVTCPASPLPPGVRDQRGRGAQRRASRGPPGPGEVRRLAERRGATRSEPALRAGPR